MEITTNTKPGICETCDREVQNTVFGNCISCDVKAARADFDHMEKTVEEIHALETDRDYLEIYSPMEKAGQSGKMAALKNIRNRLAELAI